MLNDKLLLGQYYPVNSSIHRLNAKTKILVTLLYMASLFIADDWYSWLAVFAIFILGLVLSKVPPRMLFSGMKIIIFFCLITFVCNAFLYQGEPIFVFGIFTVTLEGVIFGLVIAIRLLVLVAFSSLLTLTTRPIELTDALEDLLSPLSKIHVPAHEIAMMTTIALRFIPTIMEEFERIALAQRSRGADIGHGSLWKRIRSAVPLLVPLFVSAFRRADDLAQAMEAKCYRGGTGRTRWKKSKWRMTDTCCLSGFILLTIILIMVRWLI